MITHTLVTHITGVWQWVDKTIDGWMYITYPLRWAFGNIWPLVILGIGIIWWNLTEQAKIRDKKKEAEMRKAREEKEQHKEKDT